jgi:hypothetical protein
MSERQELQNKVHEFCDAIGVKYRIKENNQWQQKYRKNANEKYKGLPDDEIYVKGGMPLLFEYKLDYNKLSDKQIEWRGYFLERGYIWHEIRDLDTAIEIIKKHENI